MGRTAVLSNLLRPPQRGNALAPSSYTHPAKGILVACVLFTQAPKRENLSEALLTALVGSEQLPNEQPDGVEERLRWSAEYPHASLARPSECAATGAERTKGRSARERNSPNVLKPYSAIYLNTAVPSYH